MSILIKNTFFSTLSNTLRFLANAVLLVLLARTLGAVELGRFLLAISFTAVFAMGIEFGLRWYATKEVSQHPSLAQTVVRQVFNVRFILTCFATMMIGLLINILGYPAKTQLVIVIVWFSVVFASFGFTINSIFRGLNKFEYETISNLFLNTVQIVLVVLFLICGLKTVAVACAYLLARLVYLLACLVLFHRKIGPIKFKIDFTKGLLLMKQTISYGLYVILVKIFLEFSTIFLHQVSGNIGVGLYQAALRVVAATIFVSDILVHSFFPVISSRFFTQSGKLVKTATLLTRLLVVTGTYISGFCFVFAHFIIQTVFGRQYQASVPILKILACLVVIRFVSAALSTLLTASDRQRLRTLSVFFGILIVVILCIILIPPYGMAGAAIALVVAYMILAVIQLFFVLKIFKNHFFDRNCLYSLVLILITALFSYQLLGISQVLAISLYLLGGCALYFSALKKSERKDILFTLKTFKKKGLRKEVIPLD